MKAKKNKKYLLLLTLFFILYYVLITRFGKYIYGSVLDWNCQHYYIPDYFRKLFYKNFEIFPSFAPNLGAGENIYNLSYYGFLSPVILLSYLMPFVPMKLYIQISSILLVYFSIILYYKWISRKFNDKISIATTLFFMLASPLLFHSHRHIMFINYMPFLIMALIGVDNYFENGKKALLIISTFLIIMTSYFFSVGALCTIVIYGIYKYIKLNDKITFKNFIIDGFKFLLPIIIGVMMSLVLIVPTFLALLNGRGDSSVVIDYLSLFIPSTKITSMLYNTYSLGLTSLAIFMLIYTIICLKREHRFLGIVLALIVTFPIFLFILNGGMYLNAKVLIPFLPLFMLLYGNAFNNLFTSKKRNWLALILYGAVVIILLIINGINETVITFLVDSIITIIALFTYLITHKENILLIPSVIVLFIAFIIINTTDNLVQRNFRYDSKSTKTLVEYVEKMDTDYYRISNRNGGLGSANDVINTKYYKTSIYSSLSNQNYQNFYYNLIGNDILSRSKGQLNDPKNLIFNIYMSNKYLITNNRINEFGYKEIKAIDNNYLYLNDDVLPIGYAKKNIMSKKEYSKLSYPYNVEALLNYIIVDTDMDKSNYKTSIVKKDFNYNITSQNNITIDKKDDYLEVNAKDDAKLVLDLGENTKDNILFIKFELLDSNSCSIGDNLISINNVVNKLTCRSWKYHNKNYSFEYTISDKDINTLNIKFNKGNYKIKNIETYLINYNEMVNNYKTDLVSLTNIKSTKDSILSGKITVDESSYFNLNIPYDNGFKIYVDGKLVKYEKTDLAFIGFKLNKGTHDITVKYISPGLNISKNISILGMIMFLANLYIEQDFIVKKKTVNKSKRNV